MNFATGTFTPTIPTASIALAVQERFQVLGTYTISSGTLKVVLADDGGAFGRVVAGAVRINPAASPTSGTVINATEAGFTTVGSWTTLSNTGYKQLGVKYADGTDGAKIGTWTFTGLTPGDYRVAVQWTNYTTHNQGHSLTAQYKVYDNASLLDTVTGLDQYNWPAADIKDTTTFTATMPGSVNSGTLPNGSPASWLSGPLVKEWWHAVTPVDGSSNAHPWLRVYFGCRVYNDASAKVWVTVENILNVPLATMVPYDVVITVAGSPVFTKVDVLHFVTTRWCEYFTVGLTESVVTEDFAPFYRGRALVKYESTVGTVSQSNGDWTVNPALPRWDILQRGGLSSDQMDQASGRDELAFFPDWVAQLIVHGGVKRKNWTIQSAYKASSNPLHIRSADGSPWLVSDHPTFWFDERGKDAGLVANQPQFSFWGAYNNNNGAYVSNSIYADRAHQPSFVFPGYVLTGDRFLHDEMRDWANWNTQNLGNGGVGLQEDTSPRGMGWPLRNIAEALAFLQDGDPYAAMFASALSTTLAWCDGYAAGTNTWVGSYFPAKVLTFALDGGGEYGASFEAYQGGNYGLPGDGFIYQVIIFSLWQQSYLTYALERCNNLGFSGGGDLLARMAGFSCRLFDSGPGWPTSDGVAYYPIVGVADPMDGSIWTMETTLAATYTRNVNQVGPYLLPGPVVNPNWGAAAWPWTFGQTSPTANTTWHDYGGQQRVMARLAVNRGLPHAAVAVAALDASVASGNPPQDGDNLADPWY